MITSGTQSSYRILMGFERSSNEVDKKMDKNFFSATVRCSFAARACLSAGDFKSDAYTNSATRAGLGLPNQDCGMKWGAWQECSHRRP